MVVYYEVAHQDDLDAFIAQEQVLELEKEQIRVDTALVNLSVV
jgi:hypothetical protein